MVHNLALQNWTINCINWYKQDFRSLWLVLQLVCLSHPLLLLHHHLLLPLHHHLCQLLLNTEQEGQALLISGSLLSPCFLSSHFFCAPDFPSWPPSSYLKSFSPTPILVFLFSFSLMAACTSSSCSLFNLSTSRKRRRVNWSIFHNFQLLELSIWRIWEEQSVHCATIDVQLRGLSGLRLSEFVQISKFFSIYITDI